MCSCRCGTVAAVELVSSWNYACMCSYTCGVVVDVVELLSQWNYASVNSCRCGTADVVELLSSWK